MKSYFNKIIPNITRLKFDYFEIDKQFKDPNGYILENNEFKAMNHFKFENSIIGIYPFKNFYILRHIYLKSFSTDVTLTSSYYITSVSLDGKPLEYINNRTIRIHDLLCEWGSSRDQSKLKKMEELGISSAFSKYSGVLYRGLQVDDTILNDLKNGDYVNYSTEINLNKYPFSSWSKNLSTAKMFSVDLHNSRLNKFFGVICEYRPKSYEILIDINLFEEKMFNSREYYKFCHEEEVILINTPKLLLLKPKELLYCVGENNSPTLIDYPKFKKKF